MILIVAIISGLASWRLASLLHTEDAFEWLRTWIGIGNDEQGYPAIYPDTFWGNVFHCFWCLSTLVALPVTALAVGLSGEKWQWTPLIWLAASAVAVITEKWVMRSASR